MFLRFAAAFVLVLSAFTFLPGPSTSAPASNANWPQFRGAGSLGVVEDPALPDKWSATENVAWKTEIPGTGWSSPIVWGDHIFLTSVISTANQEAPKKGLYFGGERPAPKDEHRWMVYAVSFKTGKLLRIYYASQVEIQPPTFMFFVNDVELVHFSYRRYLENQIRRAFPFEGTPIKLLFRNRSEREK